MSSESKPDLSALQSAAESFHSTPELDLETSENHLDAEDNSDLSAEAVAQDATAGTIIADPAASSAGLTPTPKRKGGRKPIYATSEERKQRNRQAQAAFRERRTEYIKQLEIAIKQHEESLQTLQHNHRAAADECLMLRYKNSLLERILLEKGIDVQAELASKGEPSGVRPTAAPMMGHPPPPTAQRAIMNRHQQAQRHGPGIAPKLHIKQDGHPMHHHTMSSGTSASSQLASPSTTFSTPPTANPHSDAASPSFSPHTDYYQPHQHRLSGQFQLHPHTPQHTQSMATFPYVSQTEQPAQTFDYHSAPFNGYDVPHSALSEPGPSYPSWMDQSEFNPSGKLNPFLSPPI